MTPDITITQIEPAATYPLRAAVLRTGTVTSEVAWPGDDDAVHLGVTVGERVVAISTWLQSERPVSAAASGPADSGARQLGVRLRGMATDPAWRHNGIATALMVAGLRRAARDGAVFAIANARLSAMAFYLGSGWRAVGAEFVETAATGLVHQPIEIDLAAFR